MNDILFFVNLRVLHRIIIFLTGGGIQNYVTYFPSVPLWLYYKCSSILNLSLLFSVSKLLGKIWTQEKKIKRGQVLSQLVEKLFDHYSWSYEYDYYYVILFYNINCYNTIFILSIESVVFYHQLFIMVKNGCILKYIIILCLLSFWITIIFVFSFINYIL